MALTANEQAILDTENEITSLKQQAIDTLSQADPIAVAEETAIADLLALAAQMTAN